MSGPGAAVGLWQRPRKPSERSPCVRPRQHYHQPGRGPERPLSRSLQRAGSSTRVRACEDVPNRLQAGFPSASGVPRSVGVAFQRCRLNCSCDIFAQKGLKRNNNFGLKAKRGIRSYFPVSCGTTGDEFCWYGYDFGIFKTVLNSSQEMKQSWVFKN